MARGRLIKGSKLRFDPEYRFVLSLDPEMECWRDWAAQYGAKQPRTNVNLQAALSAFLIHYLHEHGLHTLPPDEFFAKSTKLPALDAALKLG